MSCICGRALEEGELSFQSLINFVMTSTAALGCDGLSFELMGQTLLRTAFAPIPYSKLKHVYSVNN